MIAHKFVEVLRGARVDGRTLEVTADVTEAATVALAAAIEQAEKFDFGTPPLEPRGDPDYHIPELTAVERAAWAEGLLPLPAGTCWYELDIGRTRSGLLVSQSADSWSFVRLDWADDCVLYDGHRVSVDPREYNPLDPSGRGPPVYMHGGPLLSKVARENPVEVFYIWGSNAELGVYLTMMLNSASTVVVAVVPPAKLNAARLRRGKPPLPAHRVVRIVPERYLRERRAEAGLQRLPPRLHWRRSHVRHLSGERRVLIPRCLVGRHSEAEVSHEYRVIRSDEIVGRRTSI